MSGKHMTVFGIYRRRAQVDRAIDTVTTAGFSPNDISALVPEFESTVEFAPRRSTGPSSGVATGAVRAGVILGAVGLLTSAHALVIPGVGPLIAGGPILGALTGAGGAVGALLGTLVGLGIPEYEAQRYAGRVRDGATLLSVDCDGPEEITAARDLMRITGAEDLASVGERSLVV